MKGTLKRKKNKKRITSLLLIFTLICSISIPTLAAVADPTFSNNVDVKTDTGKKVNGQNTLTLVWQLKANKPNLTLTNTQGIRLAYDNTVLQLVSWDGSANYDSGIGTSFIPMSNASNIGAFDTQTRKVYVAKNTSSNTGFLSLTLGDEDSFYVCPQSVDIPLLHIRFAYRAGKSEADLKQDTIRSMTVSELHTTNQSCVVLINAYANSNPGTFSSYMYLQQESGVLLGGDTLNEPTITRQSSSTKYGDVNGDDEIDNYDVTLLLQYLAVWDVGHLIKLDNADVNGDKVIDNFDVTLLLQYLAGWDVTLGPKT
jgi:hypothetical protein